MRRRPENAALLRPRRWHSSASTTPRTRKGHGEIDGRVGFTDSSGSHHTYRPDRPHPDDESKQNIDFTNSKSEAR